MSYTAVGTAHLQACSLELLSTRLSPISHRLCIHSRVMEERAVPDRSDCPSLTYSTR